VTTNAEGNTRQRNLLIALAVVLLIAAWHFLGPMLGCAENDAVTVPVAARRPAVDSKHLGAHTGDRVAVPHIADLDRIPSESARGRDPWHFVDPPLSSRPRSSQPHVPTAEELRPIEVEPHPRPPEFDLQYLGRFGPPDKQIAVFAKGKAIFNKQEGEVIDNKFIVARIGYEGVEIRFVGFPDVRPKRVGMTPRR
jgi:hypothetical protein